MEIKDFSLVLFTILGQTAVGLAVMAALRPQPAEGEAGGQPKLHWLVAGCFLLAGLIASFFHLGHPGGGVRTLAHLGTSWLSREILSFLVFGALVVLAWLTTRKGGGVSPLGRIAALVGIIAVLVSGMVYAPPSFPALNNIVPAVMFLLTAFIVGSALASYFAGQRAQPALTMVLAVSLIVGLVVNLLLPSVWLAGGKASQLTGEIFLSSAWYWVRLVVEFVIPLLALAFLRKIAPWVPILVLAGEIIGRIMFFGSVVHSAALIGGLQ